jgi:hypothetical protein
MSVQPSSWLRRLWLLLLPALLLTAGTQLTRDRGPLWLAENSDPSYQYLLNSLLLLNGLPPCHVDHPGTTVQTLGSLVLRATTPGADAEAQTLAVLSQPEDALARLQRSCLVLGALGLLVAGVVVLEATGRLTFAVAVQITPLVQVETYRTGLFVAPEALLVPTATLMTALLIAREAMPLDVGRDARSALLNVVLGLLAAAGLVTKLTFAPVCLLVLVASRSSRDVRWIMPAFVFGGLLYLLPIYSQVPRMLHWFADLATHQGTYGTGEAGFIDVAAYPTNLRRLVASSPVFAGCMALSFVVALRRSRSRPWWTERTTRLLVLVATMQTIGLLLVAKHPKPHYLLPLALTGGLNVVLCLQGVRPRPAWSPGLAVAGLGATAAVLLVGAQVARLSRNLRDARDLQLLHAQHAEALCRDGVRVDYYRSSSPAFALAFGNGSAWRWFAKPLAALYPDRIFFNVVRGGFESFAGRRSPPEASASRRLYFVGNGSIASSAIQGQLPPGWRLAELDRLGEYTVHVLETPRIPPAQQ